jgi:RNA polymerase sigma factor (sigma-70 family)
MDEHPGDRSRSHAPDSTPPEARWLMLDSHRDEAIAAIRRRFGDTADAEDCVQDAIVRLVQRGDLDPDRVGSLLIRTALHIAYDRLRAQRRQELAALRLGGDAASEVVSPEKVVADRADVARVMNVVDTLPEREQAVMRMRLAGLSVGETARLLGVTYKSIEGTYTRARARIRLVLGTALAWLLDRLRRTPHQPGEAFAAAVAVLFFAAPFWHQDAGVGGGSSDRTTPVLASQALAPQQQPGVGPSVLVWPGSAVAGELHASSRASDDGRRGHEPPRETYVSTPPTVIPDPRGGGQPPLLYVGGVTVTGGPVQDIDPVGGVERCLAQGGPSLNPEHGGCDT